MEHDEKITKIIETFRNNVVGLNETRIRIEHKSVLFCLFIGDKVVSVDIQKSFIDNRTMDEIKSYFSERYIYHSILSNHELRMSDHDGVFIYIDDPICRDMML